MGQDLSSEPDTPSALPPVIPPGEAAGPEVAAKPAPGAGDLPDHPLASPTADQAVLAGRTRAALSRRRRLGRLILRIILTCFALSLALVLVYRILPPPITPLMVIRLISGEGLAKNWRAYADISPNLARAVITSEDSLFCQHNGFDWTALDKAWQRNQRTKRILGGSTISNQTAKNVFLWPDRTYIRKAVEFYFTVLIEAFWSKRRILEVYLNVVEWGHGVYGAEAAARFYFKKPARDLTRHEAALLAAILPNPRHWSASKPSAYIRGRAATIEARMGDTADPTGDPCKP